MDSQRKGLGRGLASLIPIGRSEPPPPTSKENPRVPISQIIPNPLQPRKKFDEAKIAELASSIREKGIIQPLIVSLRDGKYELVSGERRFRAAILAGVKEVPVVVREVTPSEKLEIAIIENVQREDLDPIEEAAAYQELSDRFHYTQEEVARKVGKDRTTVANAVRLLKLPTKIREALQGGEMTVGHARALLGVPEIERQLYFADGVVREGWSVRELETRIASRRGGTGRRRAASMKALPQKLVQILDLLRRQLGTQVKIIPSGTKGKIIIEYYSELDLDRVCQSLIR